MTTRIISPPHSSAIQQRPPCADISLASWPNATPLTSRDSRPLFLPPFISAADGTTLGANEPAVPALPPPGRSNVNFSLSPVFSCSLLSAEESASALPCASKWAKISRTLQWKIDSQQSNGKSTENLTLIGLAELPIVPVSPAFAIETPPGGSVRSIGLLFRVKILVHDANIQRPAAFQNGKLRGVPAASHDVAGADRRLPVAVNT